ncbi:ComF family protein [Spirosoma sp. KUDC1026]|uniref:ComF family protein n=1 Tax=Spirosoma sp. KUDC1026 TaxID=2745947 RepID=UPI00159BD117|nr:ComF family protein [Spirosoma sp. KUDC1026]QKZ11677.1 ComF family protein [Spirosoma sp. KUDC1026]
MFQSVRLFLTDFIDLLFPTLCLGCNQVLLTQEKVLCTGCRIDMPETKQHMLADRTITLNKFAGRVPVSFVFSYVYFVKGGLAQRLIHQIKYKGQKEAAREIASWYGHQLKSESRIREEIDGIVSVPLHKSRLRQRGYNQADWIAEGLASTLDIPVWADTLVRQSFKKSQTSKNRLERWENVNTVFSVSNADKLLGKRVVLVDDVLTTGATIEACAIELLKAGCQSVGVITIAATHR